MAALERRRVVVRGRVQGVFFRGSTADEARRLGISGWVRNRDDGCVEAVFEGPGDALASVIGFCRTGPRHARVDELEIREEPPEGLQGFHITH